MLTVTCYPSLVVLFHQPCSAKGLELTLIGNKTPFKLCNSWFDNKTSQSILCSSPMCHNLLILCRFFYFLLMICIYLHINFIVIYLFYVSWCTYFKAQTLETMLCNYYCCSCRCKNYFYMCINATKVGSTATVSGTVYWSNPRLRFRIVTCTFAFF